MKLMFPDSPHHHQWLGLGSNAQNNAISSSKMVVKYPKPFPIGKLPKHHFFCADIDISLNS